MHQKDTSKYKTMNIQTDAVIANQADEEWSEEYLIGENRVKMVTTRTIGTSRNRNIAIESRHKNVDYILFSDDDLIFISGYEDLIAAEFSEHSEADAIKFNLYNMSVRKIHMKQIEKFHKASRREMGGWGVCGLAVRNIVFNDKLIKFNERFGPGTSNYCGEDTIFLQELLKNKIAVYASPIVIAGIDQSVSTWFEGHNEKYFYVQGRVLATIYPGVAILLAIRSSYRFAKRGKEMSMTQIFACYVRGIFDVKNKRGGGN